MKVFIILVAKNTNIEIFGTFDKLKVLKELRKRYKAKMIKRKIVVSVKRYNKDFKDIVKIIKHIYAM